MGVYCQTGEYYEVQQAAHSAYPITMAFWGRPRDLTSASIGLSVAKSTTPDDFLALWVDPNNGNAGTRMNISASNGNQDNAYSTTGFVQDQWQHFCGIVYDNNNRAGFLDGGNKGVGSTNPRIISGTQDRTSVGRLGDTTPQQQPNIELAELAIWDVALTDQQVADLFDEGGGLGQAPETLLPGNLIFHCLALTDEGGQITDTAGSLILTAIGSPSTSGTHPPINRAVGGLSRSYGFII